MSREQPLFLFIYFFLQIAIYITLEKKGGDILSYVVPLLPSCQAHTRYSKSRTLAVLSRAVELNRFTTFNFTIKE